MYTDIELGVDLTVVMPDRTLKVVSVSGLTDDHNRHTLGEYVKKTIPGATLLMFSFWGKKKGETCTT